MMNVIFTIVLLVFVALFYFSNPRNKINRWCALYVFITWIGVFKEVFLYQIAPWLGQAAGSDFPYAFCSQVYSALTWITYSFASPTGVLMSLHFCNLDRVNPRRMSRLKVLLYIPAIILSLFFSPLSFRDYQQDSPLFWYVYSIYNIIMGVAVIVLLVKGIRSEVPGKTKKQKMLFSLIILPPSVYCLITIYVIHPLGLQNWFKLWQGNVVIVLVCIVLFFVMAFKDGFMGLRLTREIYNWSSDMNLVNKGAEYTSHMLKNQTAKMEWCLENLKTQFASSSADPPEELAILSRSIMALKSYTDKVRKYSQSVTLLEEPCNLLALLKDSFSSGVIPIEIGLSDDVYWVCDKTHMCEVFANVLANAAEATRGSGMVEIRGDYDKKERFYLLTFSDQGVGMSAEDITRMFTPYFTTKNTERNFGLGLSYCKNVVEKHGGHISAKSRPGEGTTVIIAFPSKKVAMSGNAAAGRDKDA